MKLSSSFPVYLHKYLQRSLQQFADPLLEQQKDIEGEITNFKKTWIETSGDYFKAVTVLPQMLVGIIHFIDTGGFTKFYENTFDLNIVVCGVLGEGAALMYEIYRAMYHKPRWSQIFNYSITTYVFYGYGIHKQFPIFLWKQNWLFLMIPVCCILRLKCIRKDAIYRAIALVMTFLLFGIISFRLYSIYRVIDLIRLHEKPLLIIMCAEAAIEIYWLYCFAISIKKFGNDEEVMNIFLHPPCCQNREHFDSTALVGAEVTSPNFRMRKFTTQSSLNHDGSNGELATADLYAALAWGTHVSDKEEKDGSQGP